VASLFPASSVVSVRSILVGARIDLKGLESTQRFATQPALRPQ
jgi:hypothetical protein